MNITRNNVDALNALVTITVAKEDYAQNVEKVLADYRKNANIPGFRKGAVPVSMIKKQYGKAVQLEEINKLLQNSLNTYLTEEKLDILGNPLPVENNVIDWDADSIDFQFELGLAPEFAVDLTAKNDLKQYKVVADDQLIDEQVARIQKQFGKLVSKEKIEEGDDVNVTFTNEEAGISNTTTITLDIFKRKTDIKKFVGKKVNDTLTLGTKGLFDDDHKLMDYLKVAHDNVHGLDVEVTVTINEINTSEKAELNQELFDKLFGEGTVSSEAELRQKIKEDAEQQFTSQTDQKFFNDVTEFLIKNTAFELPATFLKKWIQTVGETPLTAEQAEEEYQKSENGLRYQLIEGKIIAENNLQLTFEGLKEYTTGLIKQQMAQFGQLNPEDADVENIVMRVLGNQDEAKRISEQLMSQNMLQLFKEKVTATTKEVGYQDFIKEMYGE